MTELTFHTLDHESAWDDYVTGHPDGTFCHLSGWRDVFKETYGHKDYYVSARNGGAIVGVLPLFLLKSLGRGSRLISMPFLDCGGILAENSDVEKEIFCRATNFAGAVKAKAIELRYGGPLQRARVVTGTEEGRGAVFVDGIEMPFLARSHKVRMLLKLPDNTDALMASFKSKLRSQIRRPIKEGCEVSIGGVELVNDFYRVFTVNMRDLGSPVHSKNLFLNIFKKFSDKIKIVLVRKEGIPIAASVIIGFRGTLSNPWASSLKEHSRLSPNMLLYWAALAYGCENGFSYFDFGRSSPGEGTFRFKEQWGAEPQPLNWLIFSLNGRSAEEDGLEKSKYSKAIYYWKLLPVPLTRLIGPRVRKHIGL
ncbi:MAG TPA: FemAB family XrtA/PEP-CTERM system-associated protein [Syntrophorhabdaceae bacterium]|jgi:FemAB-related protein (PEP-CTERM system-associated)